MYVTNNKRYYNMLKATSVAKVSLFRLTLQIYEFILISKSPSIQKFTLNARKMSFPEIG